MESLWQDIRYGVRMLVRHRTITTIAIIALALGIGANTAIFSAVNAVVLKKPPFPEPDRLVGIWESNPKNDVDIAPVRPANYVDWKNRSAIFEDIGISRDISLNLTGDGEPELITGYRFSHNFFSVLGAKPLLGRTFLPEEDRAGGNPVVVLSYRVWQRRYGGKPEIIGKALTLNGKSYTVVGVMPAEFQHPQNIEMWVPLALAENDFGNRKSHALRLIGRLKPGVTPERAQEELRAIAASLEKEQPNTNTGWTVKVNTLQQQIIGDIRKPLLILMGAVGFVLLIACANVANLLLSRAAARQREVAIRAALGARRSRLVRQFLTESVLLSLIGGGLGLLLALWTTGFLVQLFPTSNNNISIPKIEKIPIDLTVLFFTLGVSLLTGLIFGIVPALQASQNRLTDVLKDASARGGSRSQRLGKVFVVSEVALAIVLLIGAGLTLKSFYLLQQGDLGFNTDNTLTMQLFLPSYKYKDAQQRRAFVDNALIKLKEVPGIRSVGAIDFMPLSNFWGTATFTVEGRPSSTSDQPIEPDFHVISPDYFATLGIKVLQGRAFAPTDNEGSTHVAIINESLARRLFPNEDPIGKRLNLGDEQKPDWWQIAGVVNDVKSFGLHEKGHDDLYLPYAQQPTPFVAFALRTEGDAAGYSAAARNAIWSVDKDQPVSRVFTLEYLAADALAPRRVSMLILTAFGALSLLLAGMGIYGVISNSVTQRTHEIGVRMALGARPGDVFAIVLKQGLALTLIGLAIGLVAAFALTRLMSSLLFGVTTTDSIIYLAIPVVLVGVAVMAIYVPARRAMKVDPMIALRYE